MDIDMDIEGDGSIDGVCGSYSTRMCLLTSYCSYRSLDTGHWRLSEHSVCMCLFFTLTDRASTVPSNRRGCQSGTWSAGQENIKGTSITKLQREHEKKTRQKRRKERNNSTNKAHNMPEEDRRALIPKKKGTL